MTAHFLAVALLLGAPKSPATREAERLAKKSIVEYNVGDFEAALADVTRAYKLDPVPGLLYNLAQCHRALHHWEKAEFFYRGYLREKPEASNRPTVEALVQEMVAKQQAPGEAPPEISATPPSTVVVEQNGSDKALAPAQEPTPVPLVMVPDTLSTSVEPAVEGRAVPSTHSHTLAYVLGGVGVAGFVLAGVSAGELLSYQSYRDSLPKNPSYGSFESRANTAQVFNVLIYVGVGLLAGGTGGALITW